MWRCGAVAVAAERERKFGRATQWLSEESRRPRRPRVPFGGAMTSNARSTTPEFLRSNFYPRAARSCLFPPPALRPRLSRDQLMYILLPLHCVQRVDRQGIVRRDCCRCCYPRIDAGDINGGWRTARCPASRSSYFRRQPNNNSPVRWLDLISPQANALCAARVRAHAPSPNGEPDSAEAWRCALRGFCHSEVRTLVAPFLPLRKPGPF
jgi:hypothetical protein